MLFYSLKISIIWLIFSVSLLLAQDFRLPLMSSAPIIDGKIDPAEWQTSDGFEGFNYQGGNIERRRIRAYIAADESNIFIAMQSQLPDSGELMTNVKGNSTKVIFDESIEIYINPTPDAADKVDYQFLANSIGSFGYNIHKIGNPDQEVTWNGNWKISNGFHDGWWHFECMIPIESMNMVKKGRKTTDGVWAINLCRNWKDPWSFSSLTGGYANSGYRFIFTSDAAPVASYTSKSDPGMLPYEGTFAIKNPSNKPIDVYALMKLVKNNMPEIRNERTIKIAPGALETLKINVENGDPTTIFNLHLKLTSIDSSITYYTRSVKWGRANDAYRWLSGVKPPQLPIDFKFFYYPSKNNMRLEADISGLTDKAIPTGVEVMVRTRLEKKDVKSVTFPIADFKNGLCEKEFELPPLEGLYEIVATVIGKNVPKEATIKNLERTIFPWENTLTGKSEKVYPPFTPIKVAGKKLSFVLRDYSLNDFGLIDQISAQSANTKIIKPLLASPMRYTAIVDSQSVEIQSRPLAVALAKDNEVVVTGGFKAGSLSATYKNTWDYDGTVKVELTILPTNSHFVNELTLEIPFTNETGSLIHANSDRIRAPIAQKIPDGSGVVWDASKIACDDYIKNFCPYIYIGTGVRGLCWFAENDKNWGWNRTTPNLDVVRKDGKVILRVHLINQPTKIATEQTITFGMLAAPVKPPLVTKDKNPHWSRYRYNRDNYTVLGGDINWFSQGNYAGFYPVGKDMYFWEMIARGNREHLAKNEIEAVKERGMKYFEPNGWKDRWLKSVDHNLTGRFGKNMVYYYNRGSYNACEEFKTFHDEWCLDDYRSAHSSRGAISEIKIVPSPSFIDFNLYWYARSFEVGANRGVYWDNWFICPSYNTNMTDAYKLPDGNIVPAAGIWQLRELAKRTFIMMNERGMLPFTEAHMTSFSSLPMLAFSTVQLDWEWKYSEGDVQARFSPEYLQLVSSGELSGAWPVVLDDQGQKANDPWTQRTFAAVRYPYELSTHTGWGRNQRLFDPVVGMLDKEGLVVYKYWEDRAMPIKTGNPDLPAIVYSIPGKEAVAAIVSYAREDINVTVELDLSTLGFSKSVKAQNAEDGSSLKIENGKIVFPLKKHDIKLIRLIAK